MMIMTIEEAIKMLEYIRYTGNGESEYKNCAQSIALDMAIKALEQKSCEDCISRQAVLDEINRIGGEGFNTYNNYCQLYDFVDTLPSVTPRLKMGYWIDIMVGDMPAQACDQCKTFYPLSYTGGGHNYCPNCGARMEGSDEK